MGGAESLRTGLNHLDQFAWIGAFSSGGMDLQDFGTEFPGLDAAANKKLKLLWIACGTDDGLVKVNRDFKGWLKGKGVEYTDIETPGAHTWMVWRRNVANFAPIIGTAFMITSRVRQGTTLCMAGWKYASTRSIVPLPSKSP